jgi:hypothetical protein
MPARAVLLVCAALALTVLAFAPAAGAQSREGELDELWREYPLENPVESPRRLGGREEGGSTAGPPPKAAERAGPIPLALLFLAFALTVVGLVGGALRGIAALRHRRRDRGSRLGAGAGHLGG